jgi:hypothetical protein
MDGVTLLTQKNRKRILMIMRNDRILSPTEFREMLMLENIHQSGKSYYAIYHHFHLLEEAGLIELINDSRLMQQNIINNKNKSYTRSKRLAYKINQKGKDILENWLKLQKREQPKIVLSLDQSQLSGDKYG